MEQETQLPNNKPFDHTRPFGITAREAAFVINLSPHVKWRTKNAVETAYCTLLYVDMRREIARLNWLNGRGIYELI